METDKSEKLFKRAAKIIPGGVNSPVRAFKPVGGKPLFIDKAKGCKIFDSDGNEYIDYVSSWGPMIVGHANPQVIEAVKKTAEKGTSFGAPTEIEVEMAEMVINAYPSIDVVRMVNSGTEATMSAIRLARGHTGRDKIIKLDGCYHGHGDSLLVKAGSGVETLGLPDSPGVPATLAGLTISVPFNDLESIKQVMEKNSDQIACVILEPIVGNMGVLPPEPGYLKGLRSLCDQHGVVLIFDEVMTGFRVAFGGAQELYDIKPDLTTLGKIIGGGLPVGAFGGKREIMEKIAPAGPVYQAGTLSGNPLAMAAGLETLKILSEDGTYQKLEELSDTLTHGLRGIAEKAAIPTAFNRVGAMFSMFFTETPRVKSAADAKTCDTDRFAKYFNSMLQNGVYLAPSQFEAGFMSLSHTKEDIWKTLEAMEAAFKKL
ncbi:Glutamate-1-semialdehyde 2,1-aminomutase [hydrothermal vent metagenome]|uniref:glutamate-1-semialdehyde 2,1-aminomutase n=1 Tax=hydrothermal vent metagenome TaxID=652676 RepID=A0A3B1BFK5_9ZZZZ